MNASRNTPQWVYLLWVLIGFQSISGLAGGLVMIFDPTGETLRMPGIFLMGTPFKDYFLPGLILLLFLGILPAIALLGLLGLRLEWPRVLNLYREIHWGWTYSLYVAIVLILWMDIQVFFIGYWHFIQTFNALMGVLILIITLLPPVVNYYRLYAKDRDSGE